MRGLEIHPKALLQVFRNLPGPVDPAVPDNPSILLYQLPKLGPNHGSIRYRTILLLPILSDPDKIQRGDSKHHGDPAIRQKEIQKNETHSLLRPYHKVHDLFLSMWGFQQARLFLETSRCGGQSSNPDKLFYMVDDSFPLSTDIQRVFQVLPFPKPPKKF